MCICMRLFHGRLRQSVGLKMTGHINLETAKAMESQETDQ